MIISVWKPKTKFIDKKKVYIRFDLMDNNCIYDKGTSGYKVIWRCDNVNCKNPEKIHSIQRCHLNKKRSKFCNEDIQICHPCQFTGKGNPRYGDNRRWEDIMGKERSDLMKIRYRKNFTNDNPSKKEDVKIKKGQMLINFDNVSKYVNQYGFILNSIIGDNKLAKLSLICPNRHKLNIDYESFKRGHRCKYCYYESIMLPIEDIEKFVKYSKIVRYRTRSTFIKYRLLIDPENLKADSKNYHIDHIYSVADGFRNNIDPMIISSYINLKVIKKSENLKKGQRSTITKEELYRLYENSITS